MPVDGVVNAFGQAPASQQFTDTVADPRISVDAGGTTVAEIRPLLASEETATDATPDAPINPVDAADLGRATEAPEAPVTEPETPETPEVPAVSQEDMTKYTQEMATTGELSATSLTALATQLGTSEDVVRFTAMGMKAAQDARNAKVLEAVGGMEVYNEINAWASGALSPEDISAFNATLTSGSDEDIIGAVTKVKAKFTEVNGSPKAIQAQVTPPASSIVNTTQAAAKSAVAFGSMAEQMHAQSDPRYGVDPVYTNKVYNMAALGKY